MTIPNTKLTIADDLKHIAAKGKQAGPAAERIYKHYHPKLLRQLRNRGFHFNKEDAEEISHDVFVKLISQPEAALNRCADADSLDQCCQNFLYRVLHNRAVDVLRKRDHSPETQSMTQLDDDDRDSNPIDRVADRTQNMDHQLCIQQAFAQLAEERPQCAEAMALRAEGHDLKTIADIMNRKLSALRDFLYQCRIRFKALVEEHCPESLHNGHRS